MLRIRLSRIGKKKKPMYRLIISERARDTQGRALEILGSYNPFTKELEVKKDRIEHWLSVGASMSPTVNNLLLEKKIIEGEKIKASTAKKKKKDSAKARPDEKKPEDKPDSEAAKAKEESKEKPKTEKKPKEKTLEESSATKAKEDKEKPAVGPKKEGKPEKKEEEPKEEEKKEK